MILRSIISLSSLVTIVCFNVKNIEIQAFSLWKVSNARNVFKMSAALDSIESERAKAMSDYLVKSHEEKLKAVKNIEKEKDAEIQALKDEIESIKASKKDLVQIPQVVPRVEGSVEDLATKLAAYQKFMADYVVRAQEQKLLAMKEVKAATIKSCEEKYLRLNGAVPPNNDVPKLESKEKSPKPVKEPTEKLKKNIVEGKAKAAEKAPKKIVEEKVKKPVIDDVKTVTSILNEIPKEIIDADHGLRSDGGVGGPTLTERVLLGASLGGNDAAVKAEGENDVYMKRNEHIVKSGKAGKSRWGDMEIARCAEFVKDPVAGEIGKAPSQS